MTNKTIDGLVWNKEVDGEKPKYGFSALAENVYINKERDFTMYDFFAWVKDYFEEGDFSYTGTEEPLGLQTKIWYDTNEIIEEEPLIEEPSTEEPQEEPPSGPLYIHKEDTEISGNQQSFIVDRIVYPTIVEKGIDSTVNRIYVQSSPPSDPDALTTAVLKDLTSDNYIEDENFITILSQPGGMVDLDWYVIIYN